MGSIFDSEIIHAAIADQEEKDELIAQVAEQLMAQKAWVDMNKNERVVCVRFIVSQVESEEELDSRLTELGLGIEGFGIDWSIAAPDDEAGQEARMLVKAMGRLVSKNGALVIVETIDQQF